ncbi:MAG: hypothetical protein LEGION0403_FIIPPAGN_01234 [Legionella sp.]
MNCPPSQPRQLIIKHVGWDVKPGSAGGVMAP